MRRHHGTTWLSLCMALGASLGAATGEMGFWMAIGAGIGGGLMSLVGGLTNAKIRCGWRRREDSPRD